MAQDVSQDQFDIDCLRHIATDAEARRVSLAAAMIKLHALAIARADPALRDDALEIVRYSKQLYEGYPDRLTLGKVIGSHPAAARLGPSARSDLTGAIWDYLRQGRSE